LQPAVLAVAVPQAVEESASSSYVVAAHAVQVTAADVATPPPTVSSVREPAAQSMQELSPAAAYLPAGQLPHAESAVRTVEAIQPWPAVPHVPEAV
jgi:hypothetical protein